VKVEIVFGPQPRFDLNSNFVFLKLVLPAIIMSAPSSSEQHSVAAAYQQSIDIIVTALRRDDQFASASYITLLEEAEKIHERREASKIRLDGERVRAASANVIQPLSSIAPVGGSSPSISKHTKDHFVTRMQ
jgi:hypothetical protein